MWLCTFLLANPEGLKPCSELPFGFGGCTGAAVPVFCTVASMFSCICWSLEWICPWMQSRCLLMVTFSHSCCFSPAAAWWLCNDKNDQLNDLILKILWFLSIGWLRWHPEVLFNLNVLIVLHFHGVGDTQFLFDIVTLIKPSPACAMHVSAEIILKSKVPSAPPYGSFLICPAVVEASGAAFDLFCISHSWR